METTKEMLEARVRETPLLDRLKGCRQLEYYDDDFYVCTTLADAQATVEALQREHTQLQAAGNAMMKALRAMRDNKESWYTTVTPELMNAWDMMKTSLGPATLDATPPATTKT